MKRQDTESARGESRRWGVPVVGRPQAIAFVAKGLAVPGALASLVLYVNYAVLHFAMALATVLAGLAVLIYLLLWCVWEIRRSTGRLQAQLAGFREAQEWQDSRLYALESSSFQRTLAFNYGPLEDRGFVLPPNSFEIYLDYRVLTLRQLFQLLQGIDALHRLVFGILWSAGNSEHNAGPFPLQQFFVNVEDGLKGNPEERIIIGACRSGESVRFAIVPGWIPRVGVEDGDVVFKIPSRGSTVLLTGYLLSAMVNHGASTVNEAMSVVKNQHEIAKVELEIRKLESELKRYPRDICKHGDATIKLIRSVTVGHPDTVQMTVRTSE